MNSATSGRALKIPSIKNPPRFYAQESRSIWSRFAALLAETLSSRGFVAGGGILPESDDEEVLQLRDKLAALEKQIAAMRPVVGAARGPYGIRWLRTLAKGFASDAAAPFYSSGNQALADYLTAVADALAALDAAKGSDDA